MRLLVYLVEDICRYMYTRHINTKLLIIKLIIKVIWFFGYTYRFYSVIGKGNLLQHRYRYRNVVSDGSTRHHIVIEHINLGNERW